jgi:hypothetical protein
MLIINVSSVPNGDGLYGVVEQTSDHMTMLSEGKTTAEMEALFRSISKAYIGARPRAHVHSTSSDAPTIRHVAIV